MVFQLLERDLACGENDKFFAVKVHFPGLAGCRVWPSYCAYQSKAGRATIVEENTHGEVRKEACNREKAGKEADALELGEEVLA